MSVFVLKETKMVIWKLASLRLRTKGAANFRDFCHLHSSETVFFTVTVIWQKNNPFAQSPTLQSSCLLYFVLETIRTSATRATHIPVKTEETQRPRVMFVHYCPTCVFNLKIQRTNFYRNKTVKCSMPIRRASRSAVIAEAFLSTRPP